MILISSLSIFGIVTLERTNIMLSKQGFISTVFTFIALVFLSATSVSSQIRLNEIEVDTPSGISEPCEYIEVLGHPGAVVPANTFFLSIDAESGNYGMV